MIKIKTENAKKLLATIVSHELLLSAVVALAFILVTVSIGYENNKQVPVNHDARARYLKEPNNKLSFLANWDGPIYIKIAEHGYPSKYQTGFLPLYPLSIHLVNKVISSPLYSALAISWASLVGAIYFLLKIVKKLYGLKENLAALRGVLLFILFPTGVFLAAAYTESLFAMLMFGAIYFTLQKKYYPAILFAGLSTATHGNGLFVVLLIGMLMLEQKEKLLKVTAVVAASLFGFFAYLAYLEIHYHDALAFLKKGSTRAVASAHLNPAQSGLISLQGLFVLLMVAASIYWWPRRKSFSLYVLPYIGILFLKGDSMSGFARYALMVFPIQLMLYDLFRNNKTAYPIVLSASSIGWTYFVLQYMGGYSGG